MPDNDYLQLTINQILETMAQFSACLVRHPDILAKCRAAYWQDYMTLCQTSAPSEVTDKRFKNQDWQENPAYHFLMQIYLLASKHITQLVNEITADEDSQAATKLRFYAKQFIDAMSPTNFINSNPEVLSTLVEMKGENLITGMKQFLDDMERSKGQLSINTTDLTAFNIGENVACTPGVVVYENDLIQLIQYTATTNHVYQIPLLIIPPWVNKYYILDLQQENSLVKWLVDQGFTVFMISWVNATSELKEKQFSDYLLQGPIAALKVMKSITGEKQVNILGYCIGGTLLGCLLAYFANKKDKRVSSATFLTTLFDFSAPGELGVFIDEDQINTLEQYMKKSGYMDGKVLATVFNALRANDLVWSTIINSYLKGKKPKAFDLLYWNADSSNIPEQVHSFYLRNMYLNNYLVQANKISLNNVPIDLKQVTVPSYFLATQEDHIVPWKSSYASSHCFSGPVEFVLATSGHVAGIVNPPDKMKYGYWTSHLHPENPDEFLSSAELQQGSWWSDWVQWLKQYAGIELPADHLTLSKHKVIEKAPGRYVKVRLV